MKMKQQEALGIRISEPFHERERKFNVKSAQYLDRIREHVIGDRHYVTLNDRRFSGDWLSGLPLRVPQSDSDLRQRFYFDDVNLKATAAGVELRIEYRGDKTSDGWPYRQVIKVGAAGSDENHTLDRLEYPAKLRRGMPVLDAVEGAGSAFLKAAFNSSSLADVALYPMIQIVSQRWKLLYHPGGDKTTQIELAIDMARARTFTGFTWDMFQVEMELKKGDPAALEKEEKYLRQVFTDMAVETRSKPSPGFDVLARYLACEDMRKFVGNNLSEGRFQVYPGLAALLYK